MLFCKHVSAAGSAVALLRAVCTFRGVISMFRLVFAMQAPLSSPVFTVFSAALRCNFTAACPPTTTNSSQPVRPVVWLCCELLVWPETVVPRPLAHRDVFLSFSM